MPESYLRLSPESAMPRIVGVDAARGLAIIMVVVGHALEILFLNRPDHGFNPAAFTTWRLLYAAHVPSFLVIAGLVATPSGPNSIRREPLELLCLAMIWHLIGAAIVGVVLMAQAPSLATLQGVMIVTLRPFVLGTGFSVPALWFLVVLAATEALWARLKARPALLVAAIVALNLVAVAAPREIPNLWGFKSVGPALAFYALGVHLQRTPRRYLAWGALLCLVVWMAVAAANRGCALPSANWCAAPGFQGHFGVFMAMGFYGSYPLFLLAAGAGSLAIIGLGLTLAATPAVGVLAWIGRRSLELYLLNGLVTVAANPLLKIPPLSDNHALAVAVVAAVAVVSQVALLRGSERLMARVRRVSRHLALVAKSRIGGGSGASS
jgi:fucose 4-O-acetylase-like acetyltransferase